MKGSFRALARAAEMDETKVSAYVTALRHSPRYLKAQRLITDQFWIEGTLTGGVEVIDVYKSNTSQ